MVGKVLYWKIRCQVLCHNLRDQISSAETIQWILLHCAFLQHKHMMASGIVSTFRCALTDLMLNNFSLQFSPC